RNKFLSSICFFVFSLLHFHSSYLSPPYSTSSVFLYIIHPSALTHHSCLWDFWCVPPRCPAIGQKRKEAIVRRFFPPRPLPLVHWKRTISSSLDDEEVFFLFFSTSSIPLRSPTLPCLVGALVRPTKQPRDRPKRKEEIVRRFFPPLPLPLVHWKRRISSSLDDEEGGGKGEPHIIHNTNTQHTFLPQHRNPNGLCTPIKQKQQQQQQATTRVGTRKKQQQQPTKAGDGKNEYNDVTFCVSSAKEQQNSSIYQATTLDNRKSGKPPERKATFHIVPRCNRQN
ncbi:Hypothetical protein, putative, partial [Bodo saltans]